MERQRRLPSAGFSLIEIMIVVVVLLVIAALAIPNMMNTIANYRLRGAASNIAGVLQTTRMRAIHDNRYYAMRTATWNQAKVVYADLNGNGAYDSAPSAPDKPEPSVQMPSGVSTVAGYGPPYTTMALGWSPQNPSTTNPMFGPMGLPCVMVSGVCKTTTGFYPIGFIVYITDTRGAWAAVTVTPAARVKTWLWNGTKWTD